MNKKQFVIMINGLLISEKMDEPPMGNHVDLSIIVPCYNEEKNIPLVANRFTQVASDSLSIELILVNNGSTDNSIDVIQQLINTDSRIITVNIKKNIGYGNGIKKGLEAAHGSYLCWTHADMQTDINDSIRGYKIILNQKIPTECYVKGKRKNRPMFDRFFTIGMAIFESMVLRRILSDINAQPNIFSRQLLPLLMHPPDDFSFDLYVYYIMIKRKIPVVRFPVHFSDRTFGSSHWNTSVSNKLRFIYRTINYTLALRKIIND